MKKTKYLIILFLLLSLASFYTLNIGDFLSLEYLKDNQEQFQKFYLENKLYTIIIYFLSYLLVTALSIPGATIMTLFAGAVFGFKLGFILVSFASTIGASIAFICSRYLLREYFIKKFGTQLEVVNRGITREGGLYLFSVRVMPIVPFFVINLVMGLTDIKLLKYYLISQLAMAPATIVYINAGLQISGINNINEIFTIEIFLSFFIIGILPIAGKLLINILKINYRK